MKNFSSFFSFSSDLSAFGRIPREAKSEPMAFETLQQGRSVSRRITDGAKRSGGNTVSTHCCTTKQPRACKCSKRRRAVRIPCRTIRRAWSQNGGRGGRLACGCCLRGAIRRFVGFSMIQTNRKMAEGMNNDTRGWIGCTLMSTTLGTDIFDASYRCLAVLSDACGSMRRMEKVSRRRMAKACNAAAKRNAF